MPKRRVAHDFGAGRMDSGLTEFLVDRRTRFGGEKHGIAFGATCRLMVGNGLFDEVLRAFVHVQRECVVRFLANVSVHSGNDTLGHDVLPDALQMVLRYVLQIEERVQTHSLALVHVRGPLALALLVAMRVPGAAHTGHGHSHQVHVVLLARQLRNVEPMSEYGLCAETGKAIVFRALTALGEFLLDLGGGRFEFGGRLEKEIIIAVGWWVHHVGRTARCTGGVHRSG